MDFTVTATAGKQIASFSHGSGQIADRGVRIVAAGKQFGNSDHFVANTDISIEELKKELAALEETDGVRRK